ncbi:L-galactose dehydrogenase [Haematococcus lacustris]
MTLAPVCAIPRRELGSTGLHLSALGFGASPLGGVFQAIDDRAGVAAVHHAHARGINYFDTSPFYGATKSESVLGQALRDLPRSEFVLSTKVGRYGQDSFDFSAARVTASVAESLQRLQVPYIDIILCHDVEFGDLHQVVNETLPALHQLKSQGLVKHVGFSALPLNVFSWIIDKAPPGQVEVVLSYCHHSLNDSSLCDLLPYFESKGVGVIGASPMAMGLLTNQGPPAWHPAPAPLQQACANAAAHAAAQGVDISKLALKHSVRLPGISSTLVGMASAELVDTNIATTLQALGQQANENEAEESRVAAEVLGLLAPVQGVTWPSGKPLPC